MTNRLLLIGLNHTTAPLAVRERVALPSERAAEALAALRGRFGGCEAVLLSTCNRVELYLAHADTAVPTRADVASFLADFHSIPADDFEPHLYEMTDRAAAQHLFEVASSLDSMVLGESQILGQVRHGYDMASAAGATGAMLNPLFQRAIAAGKEVLSTTSLGEGRLSIAGIAVEYARRVFETFDDKTVLCIGAGKMAQLALRHFAELRPKRLIVCNRDSERAASVAAQFKGERAAFASLDEQLAQADVVISSTGSTQPIVTRPRMEHVLRTRRYRPVFVIDIAVPRDVEPSVGELDAVYLYNIDDLQQAVSATQQQRSSAIDAARAIVTQRVEEFVAWNRQRDLGPTIDLLYKRYHAIARVEMERIAGALPNLTIAEREALDEAARRIVNKLLHGPVSALKNPGAAHAVSPQYLHAMEKLFELEVTEEGGASGAGDE